MYPRILILNWRDINNPNSGGAEVLTHEMAKRWVKSGHEVTQFSSNFVGARKEEAVDGARIIREGNPDTRRLFGSVHFRAAVYFLKHRKDFDVVIDEIHGLPFFTPIYTGKKKVALICEVAGKIWDTNFPFPFNKIGKFVERNYFKLYGNIDFLTISESTRRDLISFGVSPKKITVLPMGINIPAKLPNSPKEKNPTIIFVGRLLKAKGVEDAIETCRLLKNDVPNIKLWIVGRGAKEYEAQLKERVNDSGLKDNVLFLGFVSQEKKFELIQRANVLLNPSIKEGFGLTVPEAGIVGTPSVAYNVEGLRDIIENRRTGILVDVNPADMAKAARELLSDKKLFIKVQKGALETAKKMSWDNTAKVALDLMRGL